MFEEKKKRKSENAYINCGEGKKGMECPSFVMRKKNLPFSRFLRGEGASFKGERGKGKKGEESTLFFKLLAKNEADPVGNKKRERRPDCSMAEGGGKKESYLSPQKRGGGGEGGYSFFFPALGKGSVLF